MNWVPPASRVSIRTIEAHAEGEPLRVVVAGIGPMMGSTILERRRYAREHLDNLRKALIFEPRGHADMYGALVTGPVTPDGDLGVLFMHNEGWSTMCGHGIIALTTVAIETGMIAKREVVKLDTPAGRVVARPRLNGDRVTSVAFENVPSFVYALDQTVEVPGLGAIRYDLAFGGAFYAYVEAKELGVEITPEDYRPLIERGMAVKQAVMESHPIKHPFEEDLSFLYGVIIVGPPPIRRCSFPQRLHLRRRRGRSLADRHGRERARRAGVCARTAERGRAVHCGERHRHALHRADCRPDHIWELPGRHP